MKRVDKKFENTMKWVKMNRAASRDAEIEFKIPKVLHTVTMDKKREQSKTYCKNFKY